MTDREMLKWAVKAAGYPYYRIDAWGKFQVKQFPVGSWSNWNSLEDDGIAFRLAVKLKITIVPTYVY